MRKSSLNAALIMGAILGLGSSVHAFYSPEPDVLPPPPRDPEADQAALSKAEQKRQRKAQRRLAHPPKGK